MQLATASELDTNSNVNVMTAIASMLTTHLVNMNVVDIDMVHKAQPVCLVIAQKNAKH